MTLNAVAEKLYNKMILNRIRPTVDPLLSWTQNDFRKARSTRFSILTLRRIIEGIKAKESSINNFIHRRLEGICLNSSIAYVRNSSRLWHPTIYSRSNQYRNTRTQVPR